MRVSPGWGTGVLLAALGCGGPAFLEAPADASSHGAEAGGGDAGAGDGSQGSDDASGGGADSSGADAPSEAPGPCAPLTASATDVYVDQRSTATPQYGVQACPFPTILQGLAAATHLSGTVTVHVAGATPTLNYAETGVVAVPANVVLSGGGAAHTIISASGTCGALTCAVTVAPGGTLDGFSVVSSGGEGIVTAAGSPAPVLRNVTAAGCKSRGVVALGAVELGPVFAARNNGAGGVESVAAAIGRIHVVGTANAFDDNTGNGINVDGSAVLVFEGGTASGNFQGIRLAGPQPGGTMHTITSLTASSNTGPGGVVAYNGQSLTLRSSTLTGNTSAGLVYNYVNGSVLDVGTGTAAGGNTFGGVTASKRNGIAGVRLCAAPATVVLAGDAWSACAPTQTMVACDAALPSTYSDILYGSAVASIITAPSCTTGP